MRGTAYNFGTSLQVFDAENDPLIVDLYVSYGTLTFVQSEYPGVTITGSNGAYHLAGAAADINAALEGLVYENATPNPGTSDFLSISVSDGTGYRTSAVPIGIVNQTPGYTAPPDITVGRGDSYTFGTSLQVSDGNGDVLIVDLSVGYGNLILDPNAHPGVQITPNGSTSIRLTGTADAVNAALEDLVYQTSSASAVQSDDLSISVLDGVSYRQGTVSITLTNAAPAQVLPSNVTVDRGVVHAFGTSIQVSDADGDTLTVSLSVSYGNLLLSQNSYPGVTVTGSGTHLTLAGTASAINAALQGLVYQSIAASGVQSDALTVTTLDGVNFRTGTVQIAIQNEAAGHILPPSVTVGRGDAHSFGTTLQVFDPDGDVLTVTLGVSYGNLALAPNSYPGVTITNGGTNLTLVGAASAINTALQGLTYQSNGASGVQSDTLVVSISDGITSSQDGIQIAIVNAAPTYEAPTSISLGDGSFYSFNGTLQVADADGDILTVTISASYGNLIFEQSTYSGVTITRAGETSVTLSGPASAINAALRDLAYQQTFEGTDTIAFQVFDGITYHTHRIPVGGENGAPGYSLPESVTLGRGGTYNFANALQVSDADGDPLTVAIGVNYGSLTFAQNAYSGVTVTGQNGSYTLVGSAAAINTALQGLVYRNSGSPSPADTLSIQVYDGSEVISGSTQLGIVNRSPTSTFPTSIVVGRGDAFSFGNALQVGDADGDPLTVMVSVNYGTLTFAQNVYSGVTITGQNGSYALVGAAAAINAALQGLVYQNSGSPSPADTLSIQVYDGATTSTDTIQISAVNAAPTYTSPPTISVGRGDAFNFANTLQIADADDGQLTVNISVSYGNLIFALDANPGVTVTGSGGSFQLVGSASAINAALQGLVYRNDGSTYAQTDSLSFIVNDGVSYAWGSTQIGIANAAPVATVPPSVVLGTGDSHNFGSTLQVTDADGDELTVFISVGYGFLEFAQDNYPGVRITSEGGSWYQLEGTASGINAALLDLVYKNFGPNSAASDTLTVMVSDGVNSTWSTTQLAIVNGAPQNTAPQNVTADGAGAFDFGSLLQVSDPDGDGLTVTIYAGSGTLTFAQGTYPGVTLTALEGGAWQIVGTAAAVSNALQGLVYHSTAPYGVTQDQLFIQTTDGRGSDFDVVTINLGGTGANTAPDILSEPALVGLTEAATTGSTLPLTAQGTLSFGDDPGDAHTLTGTLTSLQWSRGGATLPPGLEAALASAFTQSLLQGGEGGTVAWSFALENRLTDFLAAGETLQIRYTLRVTDQSGLFDEQAVTLTIVGTGDAVRAVGSIPGQAAAEDAPFSFQMPASAFQDVEGDALTYTVTLEGGGALPVWLTFDAATRTFSGTPPRDFSGSLSLSVTASDGQGVASQVFAFSVTPVNDAPVAAAPIADQSSNEDTPWSFTVPVGSFTDVDSPSLTFSAMLANGSALPAWLSFNPVTRTFSGTPPENFTGAIALRVTASDGTLSATQTFTLTVDPVSDAPMAKDDVLTARPLGPTVTGNVLLNDSDPDQVLTAAAITAFTQGSKGAVTSNGDGTFTYTPVAGALGSDSFTYTITDADGQTATASVFVTIATGEAPPPILPALLSIGENASGATVSSLQALDPSLSARYTVTVDDARFQFANGRLSLKPGTALDFETEQTVSVKLTLVDELGLSYVQTYSVAVVDQFETKRGSLGDDRLSGLIGAFELQGLGGDDTYQVDSLSDRVVEAVGGGHDTVFASVSGVRLAENVEQLILDGGSRSGSGNDGNNRIYGNALDNALNGGDGDDSLVGGGGEDTLRGGSGDDSYRIDDRGDTMLEAVGGGYDTVFASFSGYRLGAHLEQLVLDDGARTGSGNGLDNRLYGNALDNVLNGGGGDDVLVGGGGDDTLKGGSGDDTYRVGGAGDVVVEAADGGYDIVFASFSGYRLASAVEQLVLSGTARSGSGNGLDNRLYGNAFANVLSGGGGDDALVGGGGSDALRGGSGNDTLLGGIGRDTLSGGSGADFFVHQGRRDGTDTILDYNRAEGDAVDLADPASAYTTTQSGADALILDASGAIVIRVLDTNAGDLILV